jgi:RNA polymerase sigma factor (sigma-70 family)
MMNETRLPIDRETFEELTRMYHRRVLKKALVQTRDYHLAVDVVQDTFLRAWINRGSLRSISAFGRWVEVICQRECWQAHRASVLDQPLDEISIDQAPDHSEGDGREDQIATLYAGLSQLSPNDVELLSLRYFSDYSHRQIAAWLGVQTKTVKSRLYEARGRLKRRLDGIAMVDDHMLGLEFARRRESIMDKIKLMEIGTYCLLRLSLKGQEDMLHTARGNKPFSEDVLRELKHIDKGGDFLSVCDGKVNLSEFMWMLACCDELLAERLLAPAKTDVAHLLDAAPGGYTVREAAPIMTVPDMDATVAWFKDTLGWNGGADVRDDQGRGTYGCVLHGVGQAVNQRLRGFNGIHLFMGQAPKNEDRFHGAFLYVVGLDRLHKRVTDSGWTKITDIQSTSWATGLCELTTIDGYTLRIFENPEE